jgi:hypothetical protein
MNCFNEVTMPQFCEHSLSAAYLLLLSLLVLSNETSLVEHQPNWFGWIVRLISTKHLVSAIITEISGCLNQIFGCPNQTFSSVYQDTNWYVYNVSIANEESTASWYKKNGSCMGKNNS